MGWEELEGKVDPLELLGARPTPHVVDVRGSYDSKGKPFSIQRKITVTPGN